MQSALTQVVEEYLAKEVKEGCVVGPFPSTILPPAHTSQFGVIPKLGAYVDY